MPTKIRCPIGRCPNDEEYDLNSPGCGWCGHWISIMNPNKDGTITHLSEKP